MDYIEKEAKSNPLWGSIREKTLTERIIRRVVNGKLNRIADMGCGDGYLIFLLNKKIKSKEIYAVDVSRVRLNRVKNINKINKKIKTIKSDVTKLPFDNGFFDVVICSEVFEHLKDYKKAIRELLRVTKRQLIITVPNEQQPVKTLCPNCKKHHYIAGHINKFDKRLLKEIIERSASGRKIRVKFEKFHTIYSYNKLTMKFPRFIRISLDRIFVSLEGIISFFKPNYLMAVVAIE